MNIGAFWPILKQESKVYVRRADDIHYQSLLLPTDPFGGLFDRLIAHLAILA